MSSGIRATVEFEADACPVAAAAADAEIVVDSVSTSVAASGHESVTEFALDGRLPPEAGFDPVFSNGSVRWYRLTHDGNVDCPCACLGAHGCPVVRYVTRGETLTLVFHVADYERLQKVVADLRERFDVDIRRFVRSSEDDLVRDGDRVLVDRGKLTARQLEVLETAYAMGYFERPRGANATEVADELDIVPATFREHVAAAERKLLDDVL
jgi:predicted DNA binding protein